MLGPSVVAMTVPISVRCATILRPNYKLKNPSQCGNPDIYIGGNGTSSKDFLDKNLHTARESK